ncbi:hypothetical protein [Paraflavitalea speifideaquila]|uniref:hypothetical protein n=1 Tax=Paraflavitalea speifideaquila TaxID=3076558 RepID=UPI0028F041FF|nr:hypothetical protein [Paraflavitalea speifideiaquila]
MNILLHVLFTTLIVMVPIFLMPLKDNQEGSTRSFYNIPVFIMTGMATISCYVSAYWLYPSFY